jgi:hypothetical protein
MNASRWVWALFALTAGATSIAVVRAERGAAIRAKALADERRQTGELLRLRGEHRRLSAEQISAADRQQLEFRHAQLKGLRSRLAALQRSAARADGGDGSEDTGAPETVPSADWIYAGRSTPRAAMESVLWAASHGDVDHLAELLGFADDVRTKAQALFSQLPLSSQQEYGSPERVVATLLAGSFPKNATAMTIVDNKPDDEEAEISMRIDHSSGGPRTNSFQLRRAPDGWQLMVPSSVMAGYEKTVDGEPQPPETSPP